jgi:chromosome segregation ATPase
MLQQAANLEQHAAGLEQQRDQLLGQTATLEQRREELVQQAANLEQQLRDLSHERDRLSQQIAALEARMGETLAQVAARDAEIARLTDQADQSALEREGLMVQVAKLGRRVEYEQHAQRVHQRSLRWLLGSIRAELRRRWQSRKGG